jgi:hypothetical protein
MEIPADSDYLDRELLEVFELLDQMEPRFTIPSRDLYLDVVRVCEEIGKVPSSGKYNECGMYQFRTVAGRFGNGSWPEAMRELGFEYVTEHGTYTIPKEQIREDVHRVAEELGHCPSYKDYVRCGNHSWQTVVKKFGDGGWEAAMRAIGFDYESDINPEKILTESLRDDVHEVAAKLGHFPTWGEYKRLGKYSPTTVSRRFGEGSWVNARQQLEP